MQGTCHKCQKKNMDVRRCDRCGYSLCSSCNNSQDGNLCPICKQGVMRAVMR